MTHQPPWQLEELLPHGYPMILIDELLSDDLGLHSRTRIAEDSQFFEASRGVPSYVGIEYVAQTVAALVGLKAREQGGEVRSGYLLGTRRYSATVPFFPLGSRLTTRVDAEFESGDLAKYTGRICNENGELWVETSVTVYSVPADQDPA